MTRNRDGTMAGIRADSYQNIVLCSYKIFAFVSFLLALLLKRIVSTDPSSEWAILKESKMAEKRRTLEL